MVRSIKSRHWFKWWLGAEQAASHHFNGYSLVNCRIYASLGLDELRPLHTWPILFPAYVWDQHFKGNLYIIHWMRPYVDQRQFCRRRCPTLIESRDYLSKDVFGARNINNREQEALCTFPLPDELKISHLLVATDKNTSTSTTENYLQIHLIISYIFCW